jgi:hypothetical protein
MGIIAGMTGGRRSESFWLGNAGSGDGFGLIGLFIGGAIVAGASLLLFLIATTTSRLRANKLTGEISE